MLPPLVTLARLAGACNAGGLSSKVAPSPAKKGPAVFFPQKPVKTAVTYRSREARAPRSRRGGVGARPKRGKTGVGGRWSASSGRGMGPGPQLAFLQYLLFRIAVVLFSTLPVQVAMRLGEAAALVVHVVDRRHRRVGLTNLRIAFPDRSLREHRRILRASWLNLGRMAAESCHLRKLNRENVSRWVTFENAEYWRQVVREHADCGAFVLTAHFGNWELFAYAHGLYGYPVHLVYRALRNPLIDEYVHRLRRSAGTVTLRKSAAGLSLVRSLRQGGIVVIPADQNSKRGMGVFVNLFGVPASTNSGLARLAMRTGFPVYPAFLVREGRSPRHRIVIGPPVPIARTADRVADVHENTQRFTRVLEDMITRYPDHWLWVHKRWKTRPPGAPRIY